MTYRHLTTRELTLIADLELKPIKPPNFSSVVRKRFIEFIVSLMAVKPLNNILKNTSVINVTVVENKLSCPKMKLSILTTKLKLAGHRIPLLVVRNMPLAVVCGLFIGCLLEDSIISMLNSYR